MEESSTQPDNNTRSPRQGFLSRIAKHPVISVVGPIIGLTSLTLSIIFFVTSRVEPKLSYSVNPVRTTILQSGRATSLRVFHGDEEIASDVTAGQIAIWNRGRQAIVPEDVLEDLQIVTEPPVRILEASVREETRTVIAFTHDDARYDEGIVPISWRILEKDDGALVEVLYMGSEEVGISVRGTIKDQRALDSVGHGAAREWIFNMLSAVMASACMVVLLALLRERRRAHRLTSARGIVLLIALALTTGAYVWIVFGQMSPRSPFF